MQYRVKIKKKANRGLRKLPVNVRKLLFLLIEDLKADGPIQKSWNHFSPLGDDKYHCHLNYRYSLPDKVFGRRYRSHPFDDVRVVRLTQGAHSSLAKNII